jgi:iron complex outermembrane receptor protein
VDRTRHSSILSTCVAGVFDIRKPYFNTDETNVFTILGDVRHRGAELSLAGNPIDSVSLIAGAVLSVRA